jgi:hypothetical protein
MPAPGWAGRINAVDVRESETCGGPFTRGLVESSIERDGATGLNLHQFATIFAGYRSPARPDLEALQNGAFARGSRLVGGRRPRSSAGWTAR